MEREGKSSSEEKKGLSEMSDNCRRDEDEKRQLDISEGRNSGN